MRRYAPQSVGLHDAMSAEYRDVLTRVLANQARAEDAAARAYLGWARRAVEPSLRLRLLELAREEVEHWSGCVELLAQLGVSPPRVAGHHSATWFYAAVRLVAGRQRALDLAIASFLFERVGYVMVEDYAQSSYTPHARLARHILDEEAAHPDLSREFLGRLIATGSVGVAQRALRWWWPFGLNAFGPARAPRIERYIELGLKTRTNEGRREAFRAVCEPELRALGLQVPVLARNRYPFV